MPDIDSLVHLAPTAPSDTLLPVEAGGRVLQVRCPHASIQTPLSKARKHIRDSVGAARLAELHRPNLALDMAAAVVPPVAIAACVWAVGLPDLPWGVRAALIVAIGWLMTILALVTHDLFVHRRVFGARASLWAGVASMAVTTLNAVSYRVGHELHHAHINTPRDPEQFKNALSTRFRRFAHMTLPGYKWSVGGRWDPPGTTPFLDNPSPDAYTARTRRTAGIVCLVVPVSVAVAVLFDPLRVVLGYVVPLLVVAPIFNASRTVLEHADADESNPLWLGTNYRCGWLTQVLYLQGSGDCHLVHHLYPRIPFYRCPAAARAFAPILAAAGVPERRSLVALWRGWFWQVWPHRSAWPLPDARRADRA